MYRQYEDPNTLQKELDDLQCRKEEALNRCTTTDEEFEVIEAFAEKAADLRERINFAWQDIEFDYNYERDNYGF